MKANSRTLSEQTLLTEDSVDISEFLFDWQLIDEISIRLLEQGVGKFETLQKVLPLVVLAKIDGIDRSDGNSNAIKSEEESSKCSEERLLKLFRLAQLEIDYLLRSQTNLLERLTKERLRAEKLAKENKIFRTAIIMDRPLQQKRIVGIGETELKDEAGEGGRPSFNKELFRCDECSKIFLHATFLVDHIKRRHNSSLEALATSIARSRRNRENPPAAENKEKVVVLHNSNEVGITNQQKQWYCDDVKPQNKCQNEEKGDRTDEDVQEIASADNDDTSLWNDF